MAQVHTTAALGVDGATLDPSAVDALRATFRGPLLQPGDAGYEETRQV
jgi:hypothetical protein